MKVFFAYLGIIFSATCHADQYVVYDVTRPSGERLAYVMDDSDYPYLHVSHDEVLNIFVANKSTYLSRVNEFYARKDVSHARMSSIELRNTQRSSQKDLWIVIVECLGILAGEIYQKTFVFSLDGQELELK